MEQAGAVFLPAAGWRIGSTVSSVGYEGYWWSSTPGSDDSYAYYLRFSSGYDGYLNRYFRYYGQGVRLVVTVSN